MKRILWFVAPIVVFTTLWEVISRSGWINASLFPPPSKVLIAFWEMLISGTLFSDLGVSLWRLVVGLCLGVASGVFFGLLTGRNKGWAIVISPIVHMLRPLPPVAIIPLVIVWFGIDDGAKIFSIAFAVFFPVWLNAHIGARQVAKEFLWSAKLFTQSSRKVFAKVVLPATLPFIIAGVRMAIAIGFVMVFVSELSGASSGLGYRISITALAFRIDQMIAALAVLGFLGAVTDQLFVCFVRKFFPWLTFYVK